MLILGDLHALYENNLLNQINFCQRPILKTFKAVVAWQRLMMSLIKIGIRCHLAVSAPNFTSLIKCPGLSTFIC